MRARPLLVVWILLPVSLAASMRARAAEVDRVVVVQNENSPTSMAIAADYARRQ